MEKDGQSQPRPDLAPTHELNNTAKRSAETASKKILFNFIRLEIFCSTKNRLN
jgi:hypothetical protein